MATEVILIGVIFAPILLKEDKEAKEYKDSFYPPIVPPTKIPTIATDSTGYSIPCLKNCRNHSGTGYMMSAAPEKRISSE
jgi:hypothetical protein